jgi:hypothetical protein
LERTQKEETYLDEKQAIWWSQQQAVCSHPFCSTTHQQPKTPSQKCKQGSKKEKKNAGRGHTCGRTRPSHLRPKQEALVIVPWLDRAKDEARARAGSLARRQNPRRLPPVLSLPTKMTFRWYSIPPDSAVFG